MRAFLEQYGIAIFVIIILSIMTLMANGLGAKVKDNLNKEITKFTEKSISENNKALGGTSNTEKEGHVLITGPEFNDLINIDFNEIIESVEFVTTSARTDVETIDVSANKDESILAWAEGTVLYVAPKEDGHIIYANPDSSYMFFGSDGDSYANGAYLTKITFNNFDTSKVVNMYRMFWGTGCDIASFIISGNISDWDVSNVTDMGYMFRKTAWLSPTFKLDLSNWDVSNVTNMNDMFSSVGENATTWSIGDLSNWDVSNVTDMSWMFSSAGYKTTTFNIGDISKWNVSSVTNMSGMFNGAGYNTNYILDLSGWNVSKVTSKTNFDRDVLDKVIAPWD